MLLALALAASLPAGPLSAPFAEGARLGREGRGPTRLESLTGRRRRPASDWEACGSWVKTVGWWFNGRDLSAVEKAVWVGPSMLSRWMGWKSEREAWSPDQVQARWDSAREALDGRTAFALVLAAYPKKPYPGLGEDEASDTSDLDRTAVRVLVDGASVPVMTQTTARWQSRERGGVEGRPWWPSTPLGSAMSGSLDPSDDDGLPLGEYHRTVLWVECRAVSEDSRVEILVQSPRRTRRAFWSPR